MCYNFDILARQAQAKVFKAFAFKKVNHFFLVCYLRLNLIILNLNEINIYRAKQASTDQSILINILTDQMAKQLMI